MNIKLEPATAEHAEHISLIGRQSFSDAFAHLFLKDEELQDYLDHTYDPARLKESIAKPNNAVFMAFYDNQPAGFVKMKKDSRHRVIPAERQSELQKIYVLKEFHGTGVAQALMNEVADLSRRIATGCLWLDVHVANDKAIRFYEKNGFNKAGRHEFMIGTQLFHYHVMALPIQTS
ncbi:MAG TPA: GNAT family N-acetyltransferase [Flavisolibacter sp.]|jgi:ribosomal protein S18 acetylase RimI-like enzyme